MIHRSRLRISVERLIAQKDEVEGMRHPNEITRSSYRKYTKTPGGFHAFYARNYSILNGLIGRKAEISDLKREKLNEFKRDKNVTFLSTSMEELIYFGDLVPTSFHLKLPYITAIDMHKMMWEIFIYILIS